MNDTIFDIFPNGQRIFSRIQDAFEDILGRVRSPRRRERLTARFDRVLDRLSRLFDVDIPEEPAPDPVFGRGILDYPLPDAGSGDWDWVWGSPFINDQIPQTPRGQVGFDFSVVGEGGREINYLGLPDPFSNPNLDSSVVNYGPTDGLSSWRGSKEVRIDEVDSNGVFLNNVVTSSFMADQVTGMDFVQIGNTKWWKIDPVNLEEGKTYRITSLINKENQSLLVADQSVYSGQGFNDATDTLIGEFLGQTQAASWVDFKGIYGNSGPNGYPPEYSWSGVYRTETPLGLGNIALVPGALFASSLGEPSDVSSLTDPNRFVFPGFSVA